MGRDIKQQIKDISDKQYIAETTNLKGILFEAVGEATDKIQVEEIMKAESYERFEVIDEIGEYFHVKSVDDIKVSIGSVRLEKDKDGTEKVIWTITKEDGFKTGNSISMEIKVEFKGEINPEIVYPTNKNAEIHYKLPGEEGYSHTIDSTPQLRAGYYVTYDPNLPRECNPEGKDLTTTQFYYAYEKVNKTYGNYTCRGWQLKGWELDEESYSSSINDDEFLLPSHDVKVTAIWTKIDLNKQMEGTIYDPVQELSMAIKENETAIKVDTGINFSKASSETNGRGLYIRSGTENDKNPIYYYRGAVTNNNVLFAGICWQIVRTTESGGIKLIYNGVSSDGKTCQNTENSYIGESSYNSGEAIPPNVGYMVGSNFNMAYHNFSSNDGYNMRHYKYGESVTYDPSTKKYTLTNVVTSFDNIQTSTYTCRSSTSTICTTVYYYYGFSSDVTPGLAFTNGATIETALQQMNTNIYDSDVKKVIDNWYKINIEEKGYTKYLDLNTIWCNDRTFNSESFLLKKKGSVVFGHLGATNALVTDVEVCPNVSDRFTTRDADIGNKTLNYPTGMLTVDEVVLSGLAYGPMENYSDSYLYTGYDYWTMTLSTLGSTIYYYSVLSGGYIYFYRFSNSSRIRPSISLQKGTLVSMDSDGTKAKPYEVIME